MSTAIPSVQPVSNGDGGAYRSNRTLARVLVALLLVGLALRLVLAGVEALSAFGFVAPLDAVENDSGLGDLFFGLFMIAVGLGSVLVFVATVVVFCFWIHRAHRNAEALGGRLASTAGWAVGWYFVPIANLFKPYGVMKEIYLESDPETAVEPEDDLPLALSGEASGPAPIQVSLWWATWLLMNLLEQVAFRSALSDDPSAVQAGAWAGLAATGVTIPCTLLLIWLVFEIGDRQEKRRAVRGAAPSVADRLATAEDGPAAP